MSGSPILRMAIKLMAQITPWGIQWRRFLCEISPLSDYEQNRIRFCARRSRIERNGPRPHYEKKVFKQQQLRHEHYIYITLNLHPIVKLLHRLMARWLNFSDQHAEALEFLFYCFVYFILGDAPPKTIILSSFKLNLYLFDLNLILHHSIFQVISLNNR
jgi:hypothetical protein